MYGPFIMQKKEEGGIPMAGRKPKPTAIKELEGNPGKRKLNSKEPVPAKKKVVRAYNRQVVFQAKTLQSEADIDDYVEKIRSQLKQLLKNCDEIKLN